MRGDALDLLNGSVDYPALVGIHGLEHHVPAVLPDLSRILAGKGSESILSLLTVIADIDGYSSVFVRASVDNEAGKILDGVEGLAPPADDRAVVVAAADVDADVLAVGLDLDLRVVNAEIDEDVVEVSLGSREIVGLDLLVFVARLYLGGGAAEKTENLLLGSFEDFIFDICILRGFESLEGSLFCFVKSCAGTDCFFDQEISPPELCKL